MFSIKGFVTLENYIGDVDGHPIRLHSYTSNDAAGVIEAAGYFNSLRDKKLISKGDMLFVAGDRDGTPYHSTYVFAAVPTSGDVTMTEHKAVTQNVKQVLFAYIPVMGTASSAYVSAPAAGSITKVSAIANSNGATATDNIAVTVAGEGSLATLAFASGYTAGTRVEDATITTHSVTANEVITITNDGGGDGTGSILVQLEFTPS